MRRSRLGVTCTPRTATTLTGRFGDLVRRCLNRELASEELETLKAAHRDFMELAEDPELAMIATARVVMNLNEFVTRD